MPLNRKNRITVKKKMIKKQYTFRNGLLSVKTLGDDEELPADAIFLTDGQPLIKNNSSEGCTCEKCGQFNEYATPNQDNNLFICFSCRCGL